MSRGRFLGLTTAIVVASAVCTIPPAGAQPSGGGPQGYGPGMMGGYGMGPGMMMGGANRPVSPNWGGGVLDYSQVNSYLQGRDRIGTADAKANTVRLIWR